MNLNHLSVAEIIDLANCGELTADGFKDVTCKDGAKIRLVVLGTQHDTMADGAKAAVTLGLRDCIPDTYKPMNSSWRNDGESELERWLNDEWVNNLPDEIRERMVPVVKNTAHSGTDTTIEQRTCLVFLPSEIEVFGEVHYSAPGEGEQYEHYKDWHNRIKGVEYDEGQWYSLRSPYSGGSSFCCVNNNGNYSYANASTSGGVAPCFALN